MGRGVTDIPGSTFTNCTSLCSILLPNTVCSIGSKAFLGCSSLETLTIPESVGPIYRSAFQESGLKEICIPNSVYGLYHQVFSGCSQLTSVIIGSGVTELSDNFEKCYNLDLIKVAEGNPVYDSREDCNAVILTSENKLILGASKTTIPSTVTSIGSRAFAHSNITSVVIPASVKTIESSAFIHSGLASVKISEGVTTINSSAFYGCKNLTELTIPSSVRTIERNLVIGCTSLESLTVEEGNRVYDSRDNCNAIIESYSYNIIASCKNTVIPSSVKRIGVAAFTGREDLTTLVIPDNISTIDSEAFQDCRNLERLVIPKSVTFIGGGAFGNCPLSEVWCLNENPDIVELSFSPFYNNKCEILYVPKGTQDLYRANYAWNVFKTILDSDFSNLPTDIGGNAKTMDRSQDHTVIKQYNASGQLLFSSAKGLNILRMSDGTVKKIIIR